MNSTTFIYALVDPNTFLIRYIGKANNPQARFKSHCRELNKNTPKTGWIKSLKKKNQIPILRVFKEISYQDWKITEKLYIAYHRLIGSPLTNFADGGEGGNIVGKLSPARYEEYIKRNKDSNKQHRLSPKYNSSKYATMKNKVWIHNKTLNIQKHHDKNKPLPDGYIFGTLPENIHKMANTLRGQEISESHRIANSKKGNKNGMYNKKHSTITTNKISEKAKIRTLLVYFTNGEIITLQKGTFGDFKKTYKISQRNFSKLVDGTITNFKNIIKIVPV